MYDKVQAERLLTPDFAGKVALVTGGGRGLGEAICRRLGAGGAAIAVTDVDLDVAEAVAAALREAGGPARAYRLDVADWDSARATVAAVEADLGPIDVLVCNAGVSRSIDFLEIDEAEWDRVLDVNLKGLFICLRTVLPGMVERERGRVVNISSISAKAAYPRFAHYTASKFGGLGLVQTVAAEVARYGITVNSVLPGVMDTPLQRRLVEEMVAAGGEFESVEKAEAWFAEMLPLGSPQPVEDVAEMVAFLASDHGRHMTAASYHVDGGITPR
jgi:NAD(P)-dependent dehydrogenase (short-subunit alcohol dehydrogenase family)